MVLVVGSDATRRGLRERGAVPDGGARIVCVCGAAFRASGAGGTGIVAIQQGGMGLWESGWLVF